jgi:predicted solute-binding protein
VLAIRNGVSCEEEIKIIYEALDIGFNSIAEIAEIESRRLGLTKEMCEDYLTKKIKYALADREIDGLKYFFEMAFKDNLLQSASKVEFYDD